MHMHGGRSRGPAPGWRSDPTLRWNRPTRCWASTPPRAGAGARDGTQSWPSAKPRRCAPTRQTPHTRRGWRTMSVFSSRDSSAISRSCTTARSRPLWSAGASGGEGLAQLLSGLLQVLVHDLHVADHRHEVGVAVPPRNHVKMNVVGDAGAGRSPKIRTHVEALRPERGAQHTQGRAKCAHKG